MLRHLKERTYTFMKPLKSEAVKVSRPEAHQIQVRMIISKDKSVSKTLADLVKSILTQHPELVNWLMTFTVQERNDHQNFVAVNFFHLE